MKISNLLELSTLVSLYENGTSLDLTGAPGIGKSSVIRQIPAILAQHYAEKFGFSEDLVPSLDAPDVRGFLIPSKNSDGKPVSLYAYPSILPTESELQTTPRGIKFLDEFGQGDPLTAKALAPMILEGQVGDYALPQGWWVITASNRVEDRSGVGRPMMHLVNRQRKIEIDPDLDSWVEWADEEGIHPMGIAFAKSRPGVLFSNTVPTEPKPFCTPRSYASALDFMGRMVGNDDMNLPNTGTVQELVAGDIGQGAAAEFFAFLKVVDHIPTLPEILADPSGCKAPSSDRLDAAYAAIQLCVHHAESGNIDKLWTYTERLPKELQASAAKQLLKKQGGQLLNSKSLASWIAKNKALIVASTSR